MEIAKVVLEYVKVLLAWPTVAGLVALVFMGIFRQELRELIGRVFSIKFPGGGEVLASQREKLREETAPRNQPPQVPTQQIELPPGITLTTEQAQQVVQLVQSERANAALWEYRYLNLYLVRSTQAVLDWFATLPQPISLLLVDSHLQAFVPDANERVAILQALQSHHLVQRTGDLFAITHKGREYLQWRGPLLPVPGVS